MWRALISHSGRALMDASTTDTAEAQCLPAMPGPTPYSAPHRTGRSRRAETNTPPVSALNYSPAFNRVFNVITARCLFIVP